VDLLNAYDMAREDWDSVQDLCQVRGGGCVALIGTAQGPREPRGLHRLQGLSMIVAHSDVAGQGGVHAAV
jgi:hypothetical protein